MARIDFFLNFLPFNVENPKGIGVFGIFEAFPSMREKPYIRLRTAESRQSLANTRGSRETRSSHIRVRNPFSISHMV